MLYPAKPPILYSSVADPDTDPPDPHVFRPRGSRSGSISQRDMEPDPNPAPDPDPSTIKQK
jgi:hypothetical protein